LTSTGPSNNLKRSHSNHADLFKPIRVLLLPLAPAGRPASCCFNSAYLDC
jgi:hypothetical protein